MAGLFSYLAAGAAESVGTNMVEQAKAKREAALEQMRFDREAAFRRGEAETSRAHDTSERLARQEFEAGEAEKTRAAGGDVVRLEDGSTGVRTGTTVRPLKTEDGKPANIRSKTDENDPADVRTAEWLLEKGVAKDYDDAWKKVRSAKENANGRAKLVTDTYKTLKEDYSDTRSDAEKRQAAKDIVDDLLTEEEGDEAAPASPAPSSEAPEPGSEPKPMKRPAGVTEEDIISQAKEAIASGKDKVAIRSRLRQWGIDPAKAGI